MRTRYKHTLTTSQMACGGPVEVSRGVRKWCCIYSELLGGKQRLLKVAPAHNHCSTDVLKLILVEAYVLREVKDTMNQFMLVRCFCAVCFLRPGPIDFASNVDESERSVTPLKKQVVFSFFAVVQDNAKEPALFVSGTDVLPMQVECARHFRVSVVINLSSVGVRIFPG